MPVENKIVGLRILDMLIEHELSVSRFYRAVAERFPEDKGFWTQMIREEEGHAKLVEQMREDVIGGVSDFKPGAFDVKTLSRSTAAVERQTVTLHEEDLPFSLVAGEAMAIERNLIEKEFYSVVESDTDLMVKFKQGMMCSIHAHIAKLETHFEKTMARNKAEATEARTGKKAAPEPKEIAPEPPAEPEETAPEPEEVVPALDVTPDPIATTKGVPEIADLPPLDPDPKSEKAKPEAPWEKKRADSVTAARDFLKKAAPPAQKATEAITPDKPAEVATEEKKKHKESKEKSPDKPTKKSAGAAGKEGYTMAEASDIAAELEKMYIALKGQIQQQSALIDEHAAEIDALVPVRRKLSTTLRNQGVIVADAATLIEEKEEKKQGAAGQTGSKNPLGAWEEINELHQEIEVKLHEHRRAIDMYAARIDVLTEVLKTVGQILGKEE